MRNAVTRRAPLGRCQVLPSVILEFFGRVSWTMLSIPEQLRHRQRAPSPLWGEGWGEGVSDSRWGVTPHPAHFVRRPLPMGDVKSVCGNVSIHQYTLALGSM